MNADYNDIMSLIGTPPTWFDEHAVPRYCEFSPQEIANIYASNCCLVLIECQSCSTEFYVALSEDTYSLVTLAISNKGRVHTLKERAANKTLHYGDPPNTGCCPAGPTMNSIPRRVLQFWNRENFEWRRRHELEIDLNE